MSLSFMGEQVDRQSWNPAILQILPTEHTITHPQYCRGQEKGGVRMGVSPLVDQLAPTKDR